jgi:hypothetical protein
VWKYADVAHGCNGTIDVHDAQLLHLHIDWFSGALTQGLTPRGP